MRYGPALAPKWKGGQPGGPKHGEQISALAPANLMTNTEKLIDLVVDVFLIDPREFHLDLRREQIETWDSLGVVSLAVGVQETFGHHFTQDEAMGITGIRDIIKVLQARGISFDE